MKKNSLLSISIPLLAAALAVLAACSSPSLSSSPSSIPSAPVSSAPFSSSLSPAEPVSDSQPEPESSEEPEETEPPVSHDWTLDRPENHQMDPERFVQLHEALEDSSIYAMVTVKDGVILDEYYQDGYSQDSLFALHSCSKSFTSALTGIAIEEGYLGGVEDPLSDYLPQVLEQEDSRKQQITLQHLLTQTSGLEWSEWHQPTNWSEFRSSPNWVDYILGRKLVTTPGAVCNYSTGNTHLLAAALEQATGTGLMEYAQSRLFQPLGMESVQWGTDPQGIADGGNGLSMTARDAARFGQLYLQNGVWQGKQLGPSAWVAQSTTVKNNGQGDSTGSYGYQWWIRPMGGYPVYYALGAWGQYILVVPDLELVTVITSYYPQNIYAPRPFFIDYVLAAYTGPSETGSSQTA